MTLAQIETDDYYTCAEAAEELGLSPDSVRRYLNNALSDDEKLRPKLAGISVGNGWLIHRDEIERYKQERLPKGRQPKST